MTHREFLTWVAWTELEWNRPSRTDNYLMKLIAHVDRKGMKDPPPIDLSEYRIEFKFERKKPLTKAQRERLAKEKMERHKRQWVGRVAKGSPNSKRGKR